MDNEKISVGSRVEYDGARGTVKWIGEVPATQGLWYGVDWDDLSRGKHDGSHKGEKYFETRSPTSGSFVRPTKVNAGLTLEEAVRGRYQDDITIAPQHTEQLQKAIGARFVEVVGMEKIGKKQSHLQYLENVILDGWKVNGAGISDLASLLSNVRELNLSNSLLASWDDVAQITHQLPRLRFLDISGNLLRLPDNSDALVRSMQPIEHLVLNNMLGYNWEDILKCCVMFPTLKKLQVAYNHLTCLGPIPSGVLTSLEDIDVGANPISSWEEMCNLGSLPRLESINANDCSFKEIDFPGMSFNQKTRLFPSLKNLTLANNPLKRWEVLGNLNKLQGLENLVITYDEKAEMYLQEFSFARIKTLMVFNRSRITSKQKRDYELFYLKSFSEEFFNSGGKEDVASDVSLEFQCKHPTYLSIIEEHGAPVDESKFKSQRLKDLKITVTVEMPSEPERPSFPKTFLPTTKVAKVKMMLKRQLKIKPTLNLELSYCSNNNDKRFEIAIDNDMKEMEYYSITTGDILLVRW